MDNSIKKNILFNFFLLFLIVAIYSDSANNLPTNYDDPAIFTNPFYKGLTLENLQHALNFHENSTFQPVRDISYMIDYTFLKEGRDLLIGMHIHNIVLYFFTVLACWLFLFELFKTFSLKKSYYISYIIALIYAVHPIHVESVTWLFARKEPLLGLFTFLCLWAFIKARKNNRLGYYLTSMFFLILAVLSQPLAIVIPILILVLDILIQLEQRDSFFLRKRIPFYIIILGFSLWQGFRLVLMMSDGGIKEYHGGNFWNNLLVVSQVFSTYVRLIAFNLNYAPDYDFRIFYSFCNWQVIASILINLVLITSAIVALTKKKYIYTFFVAWFYILLSPVSHIFPLPQFVTDRYAFLPSLSFCVLIGFILSWLWFNVSKHNLIWYLFIKCFCSIILILFILSYSLISYNTSRNWKLTQTLWEHTLSKYPESFMANMNMGAFYLSKGNFDKAEKLVKKAYVINPLDCTAMYDLALCNMAKKNFDEAIKMFNLSSICKTYEYNAAMGISEALWEKKDYHILYKINKEIIRRNYINQDFMMPFILYRTSYCAWKIGKNDESLQMADKAYDTLIRIGGDRWIINELATLYTSMGYSQKATETRVKIRITN